MLEIKDILRSRREDLGLSMRQLADMLGVSESTVSRWESGYIAHMKRSKIKALADALKISPLVIVGIEEPPQADTVTRNDAERILLFAFRSAPKDIQDAVLRVLGVPLPREDAQDRAEDPR